MEPTIQQPPTEHVEMLHPSGAERLTGGDCCRLFTWLWEELSSVMGTPATAALLRRAISASAQRHPDLRRIAIGRERLTYSYTLPEETCNDGSSGQVPAYRDLLLEALRLVGELTGGMLVRRLLRSEGLIPWNVTGGSEVQE